MSNSKLRRGFTVIEVLVYATILLILVGAITLAVQGGLKYMRQGAEYQDAQRQTLIGLKSLTSDLSRSTTAWRDPDGGTPAMTNADYMIFLSPIPNPPATDWTYSGDELQYHAWICYYLSAKPIGDLIRVRRPLAGPSTSSLITGIPTLADFQTPQPGDESRVIARGVTEFRLNDGASGGQVQINLTCSVNWEDTDGDGVNDRDIVTSISGQSLAVLPNS